MKIHILAVLLAFSQFKTLGQIITTNFSKAVPNFREVDGKLFNVDKSQLFQSFTGECVSIRTNGVYFRLIVPTFGMAGDQPGWNGWAGSPYQMVQVGEHESDKVILVTNFPVEMESNLTVDCNFRAIRVGTIMNSNGLPFEIWDYGRPHFAKIITTNYPTTMEVNK